MHVTASGVLVLFLLIVPALVMYSLFTWPLNALLCLAQLALGREGALPVARFYNRIYNLIEYQWFSLAALTLEHVLGLDIAYTLVGPPQGSPSGSSGAATRSKDVKGRALYSFFSPPKGRGKAKLILMNHRCRLDWFFFFPFLTRTHLLPTLRIVLKYPLSQIPILGWSMQGFRYLFLTRKWEKDQSYMRGMVDYYRKTNDPCTIIIFPEGTDLSASNVAKSHAFAEAHGLPLFHHVLNPRSTGFVALRDMLGTDNVEEIIDVTIAYTDFIPGERPTEASLVNGRCPRKVHVLCRKFSPHPRPKGEGGSGSFGSEPLEAETEDEMRMWVNKRFEEKELLLSKFYANSPVGFDASDVQGVLGADRDVCSYNEFSSQSDGAPSTRTFSEKVEQVGIIRGFASIVTFWFFPFYLCYRYPGWPLFLWATFGLVWSAWMTSRNGGLQQRLLLEEPCRGTATHASGAAPGAAQEVTGSSSSAEGKKKD